MNENLKILSRIFGTCTLFGFAILLVWFLAYMMPGNPICTLHGRMFEIDQHECAQLIYGAMGLMKILVLSLFFFPWLAIRLELRRRK